MAVLTRNASFLFGDEVKNWFDLMDYFPESWLLPLGALGIALFVGWRVPSDTREAGFKSGSSMK